MNKIIFLLIFALGACVSLPMISSITEEKNGKDDYRYYNAESKILYKVTNNEKFLHLILNTNEQASIMKILKTGLTIYFDVNGKKKKDVFVHYPYKLNDDKPKQDYKKENEGYSSVRTLNYMVSQIPEELIFSAYNKTENINNSKTDTAIKAKIIVIKESEITYDLIIPLNSISNNGEFSLTNLSVGIVSGKFEIPAGTEGRNKSDKPRDVAPGGVGSSPGGYEKPELDLNAGTIDRTAMGVPINFWFKVILIK